MIHVIAKLTLFSNIMIDLSRVQIHITIIFLKIIEIERYSHRTFLLITYNWSLYRDHTLSKQRNSPNSFHSFTCILKKNPSLQKHATFNISPNRFNSRKRKKSSQKSENFSFALFSLFPRSVDKDAFFLRAARSRIRIERDFQYCGSREHVRRAKAKLMTHCGTFGAGNKGGEKWTVTFRSLASSAPPPPSFRSLGTLLTGRVETMRDGFFLYVRRSWSRWRMMAMDAVFSFLSFPFLFFFFFPSARRRRSVFVPSEGVMQYWMPTFKYVSGLFVSPSLYFPFCIHCDGIKIFVYRNVEM